jgi:DNA invertase Pin-like site-specific DNA recombinase
VWSLLSVHIVNSSRCHKCDNFTCLRLAACRSKLDSAPARGSHRVAKAAGKYKGRKPSLSSAQAAQIRERLSSGESVTALAAEYGVSRQTVYNYKMA